MLEKARTLPCDVVVLDLEDSVAPGAKKAAREAVCAAVKTFGAREVAVRINALSTPWGQADITALQSAAPDAVLLPKVERAADISPISGPIPVWAMIETPLGVLNVADIAASGAALLAMGSNDLLKSMQAQSLADRRNLWAALSQTVMAARAHGLSVIDGTFNEIADDAGFLQSCLQGRAFGFDGKTLIHPGQIDACNAIFTPPPEEVGRARAIIAAFERPENATRGAIQIDGQMVERLHADMARRTIAMADAIAAMGT